MPRATIVTWPFTRGKVSPACGSVMLKNGAVMSPTRTWVVWVALRLPILSRARKDTVCKPNPGKGAWAVQFVVPVAACQAAPPNCHSTAATPAGLSAAAPVMVAMYGGAGCTTSAGGLMVNVGGFASTVTGREAVSVPVKPAEPEAVTSTVMESGLLGLPLTGNVQLVQGVPEGPVGVALTGAAVPRLTRTLVISWFAVLTHVPGSPGLSSNRSHEAVPLTEKLPGTMAFKTGALMKMDGE